MRPRILFWSDCGKDSCIIDNTESKEGQPHWMFV